MSFAIDGYEVVHNVIGLDTAKILATEFEILKDNIYFLHGIDPNNDTFSNDIQVTKSFSWYSPVCFESLMLFMQPTMEKITGKRLYPTNSYARIYHNGAVMPRHTDEPRCQYSATVTMSVDEKTGPWEIWMTNLVGEAKSLILPVGSMAVYSGNILPHWREEPYKGQRQIQAFLHYVDADGIYADQKYDGRDMLGLAPKKK
jgi:hypothetical protein